MFKIKEKWNKKLIMLILDIFILTILIIGISSCTNKEEKELKVNKMKLESLAFENGELIPKKYTCQGEDINPQLKWSNVPEGTKSFVLIVEDPDAPMGTWFHWVIKNINASVREIKENSVVGEQITNSFGKKDYGGPCPPYGIHRYYFRLYALDTEKIEADNIDELKKEIKKHVIEEAVLMGRYGKE